jgi:hypothetical protein
VLSIPRVGSFDLRAPLGAVDAVSVWFMRCSIAE